MNRTTLWRGALALSLAATLPLSAQAERRSRNLRSFSLLHGDAEASEAAYPGEEYLDEGFLQETLSFLADDDKLGRKPGSPQLEQVIFDYMIERLGSWGLSPAGNGEGTAFKQPFRASSWWPIQGIMADSMQDGHEQPLFCASPNQFGFAMDPVGNPVTMDVGSFLSRLGQPRLTDSMRSANLAAAYDTNNIIAMIEGSDPQLKDEVVVLGAHIDHVGHRGNRIYNGADDNGSGSSILLNIARAFASLKQRGDGPKRTMVFMWFSAEEMGLLGSQYWVRNPTFPLSRIGAMLNMDMLGRTESNEISVYDGFSEDRDWVFHEWHDTADLGFEHVDHNLKNFLRRSDQYPFFRKGIPVMFFFEGFQGSGGQAMNPDYHRPGDVVEKIDFSKLRRAASFIYRHAYRASHEALPPRHAAE